MSTIDATPTGPQAPARGAKTVAPVQASALELAAAVLGDGGYVPERLLGAALSTTARVADAPVAPPEPAAEVPVTPRRGFFARFWHRLTGR